MCVCSQRALSGLRAPGRGCMLQNTYPGSSPEWIPDGNLSLPSLSFKGHMVHLMFWVVDFWLVLFLITWEIIFTHHQMTDK